MSFSIKTDIFEGPLELLLELIEKRKLFINDISLAAVADEYIGQIKAMEDFPLHDVAQFLLVASTLLLIKSKSLLPQLTLTREEQADIKDLERRLMLYKQVQELSKELKDMWGAKPLFFAQDTRKTEVIFAPHQSITVQSLFGGISRVLANLPKKEPLRKAVVEKVMSLEEMIQTLTSRVQEGLRMGFKEFTRKHKKGDMSDKEEKVHVIISFLAMLELVKQGMLLVKQHARFQDIEMETKTLSTPHYL